ncbi:tyrosine-protein phosphatase [Nocardioides daeguensis]|uniref:Tyrosine-protein phosphatase n=1 Tax=Nocardioides daeguensis TaxID=908359 RepID=A0ABP6VHX3_9ACTN|nr:tyrosine-protein phosphatase [Nocardioides daeguensis]MBV6728926.1 tyrosine-protein phosphatase [Nocardioides daeguensis]MCR1773447.1 tyrosine-protein phosphatase [Nocardioides daeguensis]
MSDEQEYLRLASADNFRDVAGSGYATVDGGKVRTGVFYRSNDLRLSEVDSAALHAIGLNAVIDLRSPTEIALHPDPEVPGAENLHFDAIGISMDRLSGLTDRAEAVALMDEVYRGFVVEQRCRTAFGGVLRQLATGGPQLFHCSQGKDRTGWVAALLLHVAGVDDPTIESDYLLTNARSAASRARVATEIEKHGGPDLVAVYEPTLVVDVEYLGAAWAAVEEHYGDRSTYLRDGLDLDEDTLTRLRGLLRDS